MRIALLFAAALLLGACGRRPSAPAPVATPSSAEAAAPAAKTDASAPAVSETAEANIAKTTERLTQALRKFAAENRRVPKSLDELVAAGYLTEMPGAPPGKRFVFDDNLRVTVK